MFDICDVCHKNMVIIQNQNFTGGGFLKFDRLVLAPNMLIGSENWLVHLSYDQKSIIYECDIFFGNFLYSEMREIQCLNMPQLHV